MRSALREKKCTVCKSKFQQVRSMQAVCGMECAAVKARQDREKKERKEAKERKAKLKTRSDWMKEAQAVFNAFIRERDRDQPCICCGRVKTAVSGLYSHGWDCGHYRSVGSAPHLRFDERNAHRQLVYCNRDRSGNAVQYRLGLIERIGLAAVEELEADNKPRHHTIEDLKRIKAEYISKLRALKEQA